MALSKKTKQELVSAVHTFIVAFALTITPFITSMDWHAVDQSAIISIAAVALRAGLKAVWFYFFPQK